MSRKFLGIISYILATVIVLGGTVLLVAYGNGYTYNFTTGKLVQRGLLLLSSTPNGAEVTLGTKVLGTATPFRHSFEEGWYDLTLSRTGYRTWHKKIHVKPSLVSMHQYVLLLRDRLKTESIATHSALSQMVASPDNSRVAFVVPTGEQAGLWSLNTENDSQSRILPLPTTPDVAAPETLSVLSWSNDSSHMLVRRTKGSDTGLLLVANTATETPVSITAAFAVNPENLTFSPTNWRQLYWLNEQSLRRLNVSDSTVSPVLATKVAGFGFDGSRVLYVTKTTPQPSLWSLDTNDETKQLVAGLPPSQSYSIDFTNYIRTPVVAVVAQDTRKTTLYRNVYHNPHPIELPATGVLAVFNKEGRYLLQYDESHISTYDLQEHTTRSFPSAVAAANVSGLNCGLATTTYCLNKATPQCSVSTTGTTCIR